MSTTEGTGNSAGGVGAARSSRGLKPVDDCDSVRFVVKSTITLFTRGFSTIFSTSKIDPARRPTCQPDSGANTRLGAVAVVMCAIALISASCGSSGDQSVEIVAGQDATFESRAEPGLAVVGERLFVYGGGGQHGPSASADGSTSETSPSQTLPERLNSAALIDPASGEVEILPDPPFEAPLQIYAPAIAVGTDIVLAGILCDQAVPDSSNGDCEPGNYATAVYSEVDREWRLVNVPEALSAVTNGRREALGATSDGRAIFSLGQVSTDLGGRHEFWSFTPADDTWNRLPSPDVRVDDECLADDTLVVLTGQLIDEGQVAATESDPAPRGPEGYVDPSLRLLNVADDEVSEWRQTSAASVEGQTYSPIPELACAGDDAVVHDHGGGSMLLHDVTVGAEGSAWRLAAARPTSGFYNTLWTGTDLLLVGGTLGAQEVPDLRYDVTHDLWRELDSYTHVGGADPLWVGTGVTGWPDGFSTDPYYAQVGG